MKLFDGLSTTTKTKLKFSLATFLGIFLTLYVEYKFQYQQFKWLGFRTFIISYAIVQYGSLGEKFIKRNIKIIYFLLGLTLFLFTLNYLSNSINIYNLERFEWVNNFCSQNSQTCEAIVSTFFKLKVYRFVSLTAYFFTYVLFFLIGLLFSKKIYQVVTSFFQSLPTIKFSKKKIKYVQLFYLIIIYLLAQQLIDAFSIISRKSVRLIYTSNLPYEERWEQVMGGRNSFGWIDQYTRFINEEVPEDGFIQVPPTAPPWEMEGNLHYIRWFIYPRTAIQAKDDEDVNKQAEYIMITEGVFGSDKKIYPTFDIDKSRIIEIVLVDRTSLDKTVLKNQDYVSEEFQQKWGVIKLRDSNED